jgi:hypothetical protein
VVWDSTTSSLIKVLYGVRHGSILGPTLFIILVSNMARSPGMGDVENVVYADENNIWQTGRDVNEVVRKLTEKAANFADYMRRMGLSMNASKTQLLLSANVGNVANLNMMVYGNTNSPAQTSNS